jgi:hypothetical protein
MYNKKIKVIEKDENGANKVFLDKLKKEEMTRKQFVKKIEDGQYPGYHIRIINGTKFPVSNPDNSPSNNLG